jgi:predicted LPLAT superfamily acyltransferase
MNIQPCLLIPIYNHWRSIRATVERLVVYGLPIFVVDDGSDGQTQETLAALAADCALVRLFRLPRNAGKGAAVMRGMREARQAGFTHALQIDADGQHATADVPRFLAAAAASPSALVCGRPIYDDSIPKGRLYGRYITHFWVGVETLSLSVSDSMCGFRLYPLAPTCALIDRVRIPTRMDFDTDIYVRLIWAGLPSVNVDTRVTYPPDGLSHFNMLRDNLRISLMHTRLTLGMLPRLPQLLWRKIFAGAAPGRHWSRLAERGSLLGLRTVFACYRLLGARAARLLLYPIVAYFFLTGRKARAASLDYLRRLHRLRGGALPEPDWRASFRHMLAFGQSGLDKLAAWSNGFSGFGGSGGAGGANVHRVDFPNRPLFEQLLASGRGAVLIGAHLGNLEMTRALAVNERRVKVNAVVYTDHAERFNSLLGQANADFSLNLLQVSRLGPETAILLKDKIDQGELVVIVGDRTPPAGEGQNRVSRIDFLGSPAPFAQGPFILASLLDCPVYLFFCLREADGYRIHFEPFAERIELPRAERQQRLENYMQAYAKRLEHYCLQAPDQWFNFYDFWRQDAASPSDKA